MPGLIERVPEGRATDAPDADVPPGAGPPSTVADGRDGFSCGVFVSPDVLVDEVDIGSFASGASGGGRFSMEAAYPACA
ncbi:MAG: hypothetical protein AB7L13_17045 [Acidimicrobiia bacterium]